MKRKAANYHMLLEGRENIRLECYGLSLKTKKSPAHTHTDFFRVHSISRKAVASKASLCVLTFSLVTIMFHTFVYVLEERKKHQLLL